MKKAKTGKAQAGRSRPTRPCRKYEFGRARPNKYASRHAQGSVVVTLDPDVAEVFPGAAEANEARRALAGVIRHQRARRPSRRSA